MELRCNGLSPWTSLTSAINVRRERVFAATRLYKGSFDADAIQLLDAKVCKNGVWDLNLGF